MTDDATSSATGAPAVSGAGDDAAEPAGYYDRVPLGVKMAVFVTAVVVLAVVFGVWHDFYWHWFEVHTGTVNESGPYYGFWSGFGSDLGEATLVAGVAAAWRHHNCHVKGCARLGRPVPGTPYLACPRHHPDHAGQHRGVSLSELRRAHRDAKATGTPQS